MAQGEQFRIATALTIGESTVKSHVNHIFSKLGVSDRTQAVMFAVKRGLSVYKQNLAECACFRKSGTSCTLVGLQPQLECSDP